jgi:surface antigen
LFKALPKRSRKRVIRYGLLTANFLLLAVVAGFLINSGQDNGAALARVSLAAPGSDRTISNPLDQLSSADIAVQLARTAILSETQAVTNNADTLNAQQTVGSDSQTVVAKPQIVANGLKSRKDIQTYTVKNGDTVSSIAAQFGVTSDTIRWSNGLSGDNVAAGKQLLISPVNGIVYQVKAGDTADSLAAKYHANKDLLVAINDAEISGLPAPGQYIIIPGGTPATPTFAATASPSYGGFAWGGYGAIYSGNGYDAGNCTWWAAYRRAQVGKPIPSNLGNASTWKVLAQQAGLGVGTTPRQYAVIWFAPRDYYGHVGFVESVNGDGSVNISEMNVYGWNVVDHKTIPASQASSYYYIY